jgi:xylan 1,4-beta-xylosidase
MKRISLHFLAGLLLIVAFWQCSCQPQQEEQTQPQTQEVVNPVLPGDRPDPTVIKIGDTYWASATSNEWSPLFPIFKSNDLINWELVTYVFPEGAPDWAVNNFWAPELAYDEEQGKVYAYYTARDKESDRLSVAVASADSPEGPYTDHGPLVAQELGSIDAYEVRDRDGKLYVVWKEDGNSKGQPTPMWAQQINEDRTALLGEKHELFRNDQEWEGWLVEGISIFRKNDYFYATYSAGACCETTCNYKTGVARAKNLLGPWEKYEGNPVLTDNEDWKCAGHGTVVEKNGDLYLLYHAYSTEGSVYVGREGVLEKIEWTEDGWPTFENTAEYNRPKASINFVDNFQDSLNPIWQWRVTQDIEYETGENGLLLGASRENNDLGSLLVQPSKSPDYEMAATIDLSRTGENAAGGIALIGAAHNGFGAPIAAMGISVGNEEVKVWQTIEGETEIINQTNLENTGETVELKMEVSDGHVLTFSWRNNDTWQTLIEEKDASHLVPWGMGFRLGLVAKGDSAQAVNIQQVRLTNY